METAINNTGETWGPEQRGVDLQIDTWLTALHTTDPIIIDVENNQDGSCAGIGLTQDGKTIYFSTPEYITKWPKSIFKGYDLIGHNIKYDVQMLRKWGLDVTPDQIIWDTQVVEYVKNSTTNTYGLKDLAKARYGALWPTYKELCGTGQKAVSIGTLACITVARYNGCDVLFTYKLYKDQLNELTEDQLRYFQEIELPTLYVLLEMEERGVQIDVTHIRNLDARFTTEIGLLLERLRSAVGPEFNPNSPKQVRQAVMDRCGLLLPKTDAEELHKHESLPLIKDLLRYRTLSKLKGTYTGGLIEKAQGTDTYRLHGRFNQSVTHTGRLSSSDPNLQNIPTRTDEGDEIRAGFVASSGHILIDADFSQIEPRLMAHFSGDRKLIEIFTKGEDLYDQIAAQVGCTRQVAKTLWLAIAYNAGAWKIAMTANIGIKQAEAFLRKMRQTFSQLFYWKDQLIAETEIKGGVTTLFGRFIPISQEWAHLGPNYKTQGSAADVMKLAMIATRSYSPVIQCHDEILFDLPSKDSLSQIKSLMEGVVKLSVPLIVEAGTGESWKYAKK